MDGIFKTVPTIFQKLYTNRAIVGTGGNAKVLSLMHALMIRKIEECYTRLFGNLNDFAAECE